MQWNTVGLSELNVHDFLAGSSYYAGLRPTHIFATVCYDTCQFFPQPNYKETSVYFQEQIFASHSAFQGTKTRRLFIDMKGTGSVTNKYHQLQSARDVIASSIANA
jgi:hypothetical protein